MAVRGGLIRDGTEIDEPGQRERVLCCVYWLVNDSPKATSKSMAETCSKIHRAYVVIKCGDSKCSLQLQGITYLGTEWWVKLYFTMLFSIRPRAMNPVVRGDIRVSEFLDSVGGFRYKERRNTLLNILDVNLDWRMHMISDGERRRVQLVMGLMVPWTLLLLDEVGVVV